MGEKKRLLVIDDNVKRVSRISEQISKQDSEILIEYPLDFKTLIQLIKSNSYDGIITLHENGSEVFQRADDVINLSITSHELIAEKIKQTLNTRPHTRTFSPLPDKPQVITEGRKLFIVYEDGSKEFWGLETEVNIRETASRMELELRAMKWVKNEIERFIGDLTEEMKYSDVPQDKIPDIIYEGYRSVLFSFKKINFSFNTR